MGRSPDTSQQRNEPSKKANPLDELTMPAVPETSKSPTSSELASTLRNEASKLGGLNRKV